MMKKRLLSLLLAVMMIVTAVPVAAMAAGTVEVAESPAASGYEYAAGTLLLYGYSTEDTMIVPDGTVIEVIGYNKIGAVEGAEYSITGSGVLEIAGTLSGGEVTLDCGYVTAAAADVETLTVKHGYTAVSGAVDAEEVAVSGGYLTAGATVTADDIAVSGGFLEADGFVGDVSNAGGVVKASAGGIDGDVTASGGVTIVTGSAPAITGDITMTDGEKLFLESNCSELSELGSNTSVVLAKSAIYKKSGEQSYSDATMDSVYVKANLTSSNALELVGGSYVTGYAEIGNTSSSATRHVSGSGTFVAAKGLHANNYATFTTTGTLIGIAPTSGSSVVAGIRLVYGTYTSGEFIGISNTTNCAAFRFQAGRGSYNSSKPLYILDGSVRLVAVSTQRSNSDDALHVNSGSGSGPAFQMNGGSLTCYSKKGNGVEFDHGAEINGGKVSAVGLGSYGYGLTCTANTLLINGGEIGAYGSSASLGDTNCYMKKGTAEAEVVMNLAGSFGGEFDEFQLSDARKKFSEHTKSYNNGKSKICYFGELKDAFTLTYRANGGYDPADTDINAYEVTVLEQEDYELLTESPFVHDAQDGIDVVWFGWSETRDDTVYTKDDTAPEAVETVDIADDVEVFALWGLDINENDTADVLEDTYTVTYEAAGNTSLTEAVVYTGLLSGEAIPEAPAVTADTGFELGDWVLTEGEEGEDGTVGEEDLVYTLEVESLYWIVFENYNGDELQSGYWAAGETPVYSGELPEKPADLENTYFFNGWTPEIEEVTEDAVYTAVYTTVPIEYDIIYIDGVDGEAFDAQEYTATYGEETPAFDGEPELKGYEFIGWDPEVEPTVTGDAVYVAQWEKKDYHWLLALGAGPSVEVKGLNTEDHMSYIIGRGANTFAPQGTVTRAEAATMFYRLMEEDYRYYYLDNAASYADVSASAWYTTAIATLEAAGIIQDTDEGGNFRPNAPITRAEMAVMAAQFCEVSGSVGDASFYDVASYHWAADEIAIMEFAGFIEGLDGYYRPEDTLTRAECVTIINRMLRRGAEAEDMLPGMTTFVDVAPGAWYYEAVQEAANSHTYSRTGRTLTGENFKGEYWLTLEKNPNW